MSVKFSQFGERFTNKTGILELMQDLGEALASGGDNISMLGGGNPAAIPQMQQAWRARMEQIMANGDEFDKLIGNYDPPQGNEEFLSSLAEMLRKEYGWNVSSKNIAVTNGGQTAFFFLMNLFGERGNGEIRREILLPLVPEYIGYADLGVNGPSFRAVKPRIEFIGAHQFKYSIDFDSLEIRPETAAICVSRPTNPSGNVLTDEEIGHLAELAKKHKIPLIIDNAYGAPFPNIIFKEINPIWNENIVMTMSLSKIGMPGVRTGIVVASEKIIEAMTSLNAIVGLANNSVGQVIAAPMLRSGELVELSNRYIRPFYEEKSTRAIEMLHKYMPQSEPWRVHLSEGAMFLWVWMPNLPKGSKELYDRLKARGVIIVPGEYFFFGMDEDWAHRNECFRMSFAMKEESVKRGIQIIGEEVAKLYAEA